MLSKQLYFPKLKKNGIENLQVPWELARDLVLSGFFECLKLKTL